MKVCLHSIIRFRPYVETGEFVNVGVLVADGDGSSLHWRLETSRHRRVTTFFEELDRRVFTESVKSLKRELERIEDMIDRPDLFQQRRSPGAAALLADLARAKEGLLVFTPPAAIWVPSAEEALDDLYKRFVERQFAKTPEYQVTLMIRAMGDRLAKWNLRSEYVVRRPIGDSRYHMVVPFLRRDGAVAIHPVALSEYGEQTDLFRHADSVLSAVRRMREFGTLPKALVVPVRLPTESRLREAGESVMEELNRMQVVALRDDDEAKIRDALFSQPPQLAEKAAG